jgi:hypothetical protein
MRFTLWLTLDEGRRELATAYRSSLQGVPQDPIHHPEGDVLNRRGDVRGQGHIQLVRKALPGAVSELNKLKITPPFSNILSDIDFTLNSEEVKILSMAAWLHDIGKATATKVDPKTGKIHAIGHEDPEHYLPQLEKLKELAPPETVNLYIKNATLINFLIERHMDFVNKDGFPSSVLRAYFQNGKVKNTEEMKLLLILMWADKMGRRPEETIAKSISGNADRLAISSNRSTKKDANIANQSKPFIGDPVTMNAALLKKGLNDRTQRYQALRGKFPDLSDQEILNIISK